MLIRSLCNLTVILLTLAGLAGGSAHAQGYATRWIGTYRCAQGVTGVELTLRTGTPNAPATATFEFFPIRGDPNVTTGSFEMRGFVGSDREGTYLTLVGDHWVLQPPDYIMVDFQGRFSDAGTALTGIVIAQNQDPNPCTSAALVRVQP